MMYIRILIAFEALGVRRSAFAVSRPAEFGCQGGVGMAAEGERENTGIRGSYSKVVCGEHLLLASAP